MPPLRSHLLHRSGTLCVEHYSAQRPSRKVALTFTWSGNTELSGAGYAGKFLFARGFDLVAFKSSADRWFQDIPPATVGEVSALLRANGYQTRVGYGASMGGTAAIQFSAAFALDRVLAYSPQFRLDSDPRFAPLADGLNWRYPIDRMNVSRDCRFFFVFDPYDPDVRHVEAICRYIPQGHCVPLRLPFVGHLSAHFLQDAGLLKPLSESVLCYGRVPDLRFRLARRQSKTYFISLAERALRRQRHLLALGLAGRALELSPENGLSHSLLSQALFGLDRNADGMEALRRAAALSQDDPHFLATLSNRLAIHGDYAASLAAIERSISLDPRIEGFHLHRAAVQDQLRASGTVAAPLSSPLSHS